MRFEWDETKRCANIEKHGIDFDDIPAMFDGPILNQRDRREDYGEDRWIGLGLLGSGTVVVVYTEPDDEVIRIISARKADRHERHRFQQELLDRLGPAGGSFRR